jgi:hypothetical protein
MRLATIAICLVITASAGNAAAAGRTIALADGVDSLVVPANAPMRFRSVSPSDEVRFTGQFVLTGAFHYGCVSECDSREQAFEFYVTPDADLQARLPHWSRRAGEMEVTITGERALVRRVIALQDLALLKAGKLDAATGRVAIVVRNYTAQIVCDAPYYSARFVAMAGPVRQAVAGSGDFGC